MRSPNGPLFKTYEVVAILAVLVGAVCLSALQLVY